MWPGLCGLYFDGEVCQVQPGPFASPHSTPPQALLLSGTWALRSPPPQMRPLRPSPLQQQPATAVGAGFPARAAVDRLGVDTEAAPFPAWLSIVQPLWPPAARSLAPAHIPGVRLWVSGLELVSVRGTEFSQD